MWLLLICQSTLDVIAIEYVLLLSQPLGRLKQTQDEVTQLKIDHEVLQQQQSWLPAGSLKAGPCGSNGESQEEAPGLADDSAEGNEIATKHEPEITLKHEMILATDPSSLSDVIGATSSGNPGQTERSNQWLK